MLMGLEGTPRGSIPARPSHDLWGEYESSLLGTRLEAQPGQDHGDTQRPGAPRPLSQSVSCPILQAAQFHI